MISRFREIELFEVMTLVQDADIVSRLQFTECQHRFRQMIEGMKSRTANVDIIKVIDYLLKQTDKQLSVSGNASEYKRLIGQ
jgi:hypothetical protein